MAATYQRQVRSRSSSAFSALRAASYPRRLCSEHRAIESAAAAIEDGALWSLDLSHGVDWHDDWPFQPFGRVHSVKRNRLFLSVWASFGGLGLVSPCGRHRLCESAEATDRVGAGEAQVEIDIGKRTLGLAAMSLKQDRPHTQHIDCL